MEWTDEAIVLGARQFGESGLLAEVFARSHGRVAALVYGGAGRRMKPLLEAGNSVRATWKGRLHEQLGYFSPLELVEARAGRAMEDKLALGGLTAITALIRDAAPERSPLPGVFDALCLVLDHIHEPDVWPPLYVRFELGLLSGLGYGLDLSHCALTGATEGLAYVSPKSGRAASLEAGAPFADKLFRLPPFLLDSRAPLEEGDIADGLALAGSFLDRRVFDPQGSHAPEPRRRMIELLGFAGRL